MNEKKKQQSIRCVRGEGTGGGGEREYGDLFE